METGKILFIILSILVSVVAVIIYISLSTKLFRECEEEISGAKSSILSSLSNCIDLCWAKHGFGEDVYSEDCYVVEVRPINLLSKTEIEEFFGKKVKVYFNALHPDIVQKIKIRYNSTGREISLVLVG